MKKSPLPPIWLIVFILTARAGAQAQWANSSGPDGELSEHVPVGVADTTPQLLFPPDSAVLFGAPVFRWSSINGAILYHLQSGSDRLFKGSFLANDSTLTDTLCPSLPRDSTLIQPGAGRYYWRVRAKTAGGWLPWSLMTWSYVLSPCDVKHAWAAPVESCLLRNYPNPFNPSTTIRYELPRPLVVRLSVFDILGREVSVLVDGKKEQGAHEVTFNAANLSSGLYVCTMRAGDYAATVRMLVLK